jgi:hypothetical protein
VSVERLVAGRNDRPVESGAIVNPRSRTLRACQLDDRRWGLLAMRAGGAVVRAEPFVAVELEIARLWAD